MSSTLEARSGAVDMPPAESQKSGWANQDGFDEFNYVPVSPWGVLALVMGVASLTGFMNSVFGLCLAFFSILVGIAAIMRIRSEGGAVKGNGLAISGTVLALACLVFGSMKLSHAYQTECPEGYQRVNFPGDISDKQFVYFQGNRRLHPDVAPLIGQQVFLKGYMWETREPTGLKEFVFLKDNGECCFGGAPKPYDMMLVRMEGDKTTDAYSSMVAISGVLHANVTAGEGEPVYTIDAHVVEEAQTSF